MRRAVLVLALACSCSGTDGVPALFPANYAATYQEVRACRMSLEHAAYVRVLASSDAVAAYRDRMTPFPVGSIVLKEEYAQSDDTCSKPIVRYTVMQKLDAQASTATLDWQWQKADAQKHEVTTDLMSCVNCHAVCGKAPMGYDGTCAEPP